MRPGAPASPLVPHGAMQLTICDYNGMNATTSTPQFGLLAAAQTRSTATMRRITAELDALKPSHGTTNCPFDDASQAVLSFHYGSADVILDVGTNGCNEITSGSIHRLALGAPVVAQIEKLAQPVTGLRWATVVGHLRLCGGPAPGRCYIENYDGGDRVVVHAPGDPWLAMATIEHGRFRFRVAAAGTYTFAFYAGNTLVKQLRRRLVAGRITHVVFLIPIP